MPKPLVHKAYLAPRIDKITVIGVGGTGSYLIPGICKIINGYDLNCDLHLIDGDVVEPKNCKRQNFMPWEVGELKAQAMAHRMLEQYGVSCTTTCQNINSFPEYGTDLIITAVDTLTVRKSLKGRRGLWLDLGNEKTFGQAVLGTTTVKSSCASELKDWSKNPYVNNLPSPYVVTGLARRKGTKKKSQDCASMPFDEQGIFINEIAAQAGLKIIFDLLVKGSTKKPCIYFNNDTGIQRSQSISQSYFEQYV